MKHKNFLIKKYYLLTIITVFFLFFFISTITLAQEEGLPEFHKPLNWWRLNHDLSLKKQGYFHSSSLDMNTSCGACHRNVELSCHSCHLKQKVSLINEAEIISQYSLNAIKTNRNQDLNNCLSCHPQSVLKNSGLNYPLDPGLYLPFRQSGLKCPALKKLGQEMALTGLSLNRAQKVAGVEKVQALKLEAQDWEQVLASSLVNSRGQQITTNFKRIRLMAEQEISRPALRQQRYLKLIIFASPFLLFCLVFSRAAFKQGKRKSSAAKHYYILATIFLSLMLIVFLTILLLPKKLFYPDLLIDNNISAEKQRAPNDIDRYLLSLSLIEAWEEIEPNSLETVLALEKVYKALENDFAALPQPLSAEAPWPQELAVWGLIAQNAAKMSFSDKESAANKRALAIWEEQFNWLQKQNNSPLKAQVSLMLVQSLALNWASIIKNHEKTPFIMPLSAENKESNDFSLNQEDEDKLFINSNPQKIMNELLLFLLSPEDLAQGLVFYGEGLVKANLKSEAFKVFSKAYEIALYIENKNIKINVFLQLNESWNLIDIQAGRKTLSEALAVASDFAKSDQQRAYLIVKIARAWARQFPKEAVTLATDLAGDYERWLTKRALFFALSDSNLQQTALKRYLVLNKSKQYDEYRVYLQSADLNFTWSKLKLNNNDFIDGNAAGEEQKIMAQVGLRVLLIHEAFAEKDFKKAHENWQAAWNMVQIVSSQKNDLEGAKLYQSLGDFVISAEKNWALKAYQEAFEVLNGSKD